MEGLRKPCAHPVCGSKWPSPEDLPPARRAGTRLEALCRERPGAGARGARVVFQVEAEVLGSVGVQILGVCA